MRVAWIVVCAALLAGCTTDDTDPEPGPPTIPPSPPPSAATTEPTEPSTEPSTAPVDAPRVHPDDVRVVTALRAVRRLAGEIGPRPGTSPAYFEAADYVEARLTKLGWQVDQQSFRAPAGFSVAGPTEGLPVEAGRSVNVIATRGDVVPGEPWVAVGAHLDTVPTSPGAEDNASGVGALLAVAEAVTGRRTRLPVVVIAFGAEEPRGPSDDDHHYGSRAYVASLSDDQRGSLAGMVALDRVGVGDVVPVGSPEDGDPLRAELVRAARRAGVPVVVESGQRSSDHWSFAREGMPGVRLGSTPYAGYHSADDVVAVVDAAQLTRVARVVVSWLR